MGFKEDCEKAQLSANRANVALMLKPGLTFYMTILFSLKREWDESIRTAATNGLWLKINPLWWDKIEPKDKTDKRIGLLIHEVMHICLEHLDRCGDSRNPRKYNKAADHVINLQLLEEGYALPDDGLFDNQYRNMSTDEVYDLLPEEEEDYEMDLDPGDNLTEEEKQKIKQDIQGMIIKAYEASKIAGDAGNIPGGIRDMINTLINPKIPWQGILANYMTTYVKEDYSWKRPNRRYLNQGMYLPSLYSESIGEVMVGIDISGSISQEMFRDFLSEVEGIREQLKPSKVIVAQWHTKVAQLDEVMPDDDILDIQLAESGGTDINDFMQLITERDPVFALIFTDGEFFSEYHMDFNSDVFWIIWGNGKSSFTAEKGIIIDYGE